MSKAQEKLNRAQAVNSSPNHTQQTQTAKLPDFELEAKPFGLYRPDILDGFTNEQWNKY